MATLFTWLSQPSRAKFLGLLLVAGSLQASDEVPERYDQVHETVRWVEHFANFGYDPVRVAHLPPTSAVRIEVERRYAQLQARNNRGSFINTCAAYMAVGILLAAAIVPSAYVAWLWKPHPMA